jgi:ATP-dependent 26S proteasome regulatory subunit
LLSELRDVTAVVLSGAALAMIAQACAIARSLAPSLVIMEDIDLIAGDRSFRDASPLLFEVLNQIDGLNDDVDVTFILTTNRADILERALAQRPGRVDAAVEVAAPDEVGRRRLFRLYARGLTAEPLSDDELDPAVELTEGRTATYIRETVRRAALDDAEQRPAGALRVDGAALAVAARHLIENQSALTRTMIGGAEWDQPGVEGDGPMAMPPSASGPMMRAQMMMMRQMMQGQPPPFAE